MDELSTNIYYSSEQQFYIKKALNLLIPSFEFKHMKEKADRNPLLVELKVPLKEKMYLNRQDTFYPSELVEKTKIIQNFEKQMEQEQNLMIQVPSIKFLNRSEQKSNDKNVYIIKKIIKINNFLKVFINFILKGNIKTKNIDRFSRSNNKKLC